MSLDDRLNPNDGSLLDKLDTALLNAHKKVGRWWQDKTYRSKDLLVKNLRMCSSTACLTAAITAVPYSLYSVTCIAGLLSLTQGARFALGFKHSTGLEKEIEDEYFGLPKKTSKFFDVFYYGLGALTTTWGVSGLIYETTAIDGQPILGISFLSLSFGLFLIKTGDYLDKIDAGEPPKKPKKKPVLEWIKDKIGELLPRPTPEPSPVKLYSGTNGYYLS